MLVRTTCAIGFRELTLTTRLISSRLTPKCVTAATTTCAKTSAASSPRSGAIASAGRHRGDCEHRRVVEDADRRPVLEHVHDRRREADDHARLPAVEHDRGRAEDEAERDAAGVDPVERDRVALGERRRREQAGDPRQRRHVAAARRRTKSRPPRRPRDPSSPTGRTTAASLGGILPPDSQGGPYQPQVKLSQPQFPKAAARLPRATRSPIIRAFFHCNMSLPPTAGRQTSGILHAPRRWVIPRRGDSVIPVTKRVG